MTKTRKAEILYKRAHGQYVNESADEKRELKKYKVSEYDRDYATKSNINAYITAVDKGCHISFYDWCKNNYKMDRRRKGSSEREMADQNFADGIGAILLGWLFWGMAIYWMLDGSSTAGSCVIMGAIVSVILQRLNRRWIGYTLFLLPIILTAVFGS